MDFMGLVFHSNIQQTKFYHTIFTYHMDYCIDVLDDFRPRLQQIGLMTIQVALHNFM